MSVYRPTYTDPKTGKQKQSKVWWFEFIYRGKRVRESAKTTRKTIAVEAEKQRRLMLERAAAGLPTVEPERLIADVKGLLKTYRAGYAVNHRDRSVTWVEERSQPVERLMGALLLPDLTEDRVREYMRTRQQEGVGNRTINMELSILSRALGRTWRELWPKVKKLEEPSDVGRALEADEEKRVLEAAARSKSKLIYPYLVTLAWTGLRADEARTLRWFQINFDSAEVRVAKSKTEAGKGRAIPMSGTLRLVLEHHLAWYRQSLGQPGPDDYVFPLCDRVKPISRSTPIGSMKKAWEAVRKTAQVSCRLHDLRHSFCTKLAEAGVPEATMLDIMGHMSAAMLRRYSHIRDNARRDAIRAIEGKIGAVPQELPKVVETHKAKTPLTH